MRFRFVFNRDLLSQCTIYKNTSYIDQIADTRIIIETLILPIGHAVMSHEKRKKKKEKKRKNTRSIAYNGSTLIEFRHGMPSIRIPTIAASIIQRYLVSTFLSLRLIFRVCPIYATLLPLSTPIGHLAAIGYDPESTCSMVM